MYYNVREKKAKDLALNNGQDYHLAAILVRKKTVVRIGTNSNKTHPRFLRTYKDGTERSQLHAEMDVLRFAQPGDTLFVTRWKADGSTSMAKPCEYCQKFIREVGITEVYYTNWDGKLVKMEM